MKNISAVVVSLLFSTITFSQAIDPQKSARAAALSDSKFIANSIEDDKDFIFLSQKAVGRATDSRIRELAEQLVTDHSAMLYSMEQLQSAGTGSSNQKTKAENAKKQAVLLNSGLALVSGGEFDSMWVNNLFLMQQAKYDELTLAKQTVTNPQLNMTITAALPIIRKNRSQLKTLQNYLVKMAAQRKKEAAAQEKLEKRERLQKERTK